MYPRIIMDYQYHDDYEKSFPDGEWVSNSDRSWWSMATSAAWVELLGTASTVASEPVWDQNLMEPETQNNPEIPRSRGALWGKLISVFFLRNMLQYTAINIMNHIHLIPKNGWMVGRMIQTKNLLWICWFFWHQSVTGCDFLPKSCGFWMFLTA